MDGVPDHDSTSAPAPRNGRTFAAGVEAPNKAADRRAKTTARRFIA